MFVRALTTAWTQRANLPTAGPDEETERWLARLAAAEPRQVLGAVIAGPAERVRAAVRLLLARDVFETDPALLALIVSQGHGTDFEGAAHAAAHAQFQLGLQRHLHDPFAAHRAYELARYGYVAEQAPALAQLAAFASATVKGALLGGGDRGAADAELAALDPTLAGELAAPFDAYVRVVAWTVAPDGAPPELDDEGRQIVTRVALAEAEHLPTAVRLARLAGTLELVASQLTRGRRWADAAVVLEELLAAAPDDREAAAGLARCYVETGRWPEGKALLISRLGDPLSADDLPLLEPLAAHSLKAEDEDAKQWRQRLIALDPENDPLTIVPTPEAAPPPLQARMDGTSLEIGPGYFELPEEERPAHMMAAMISGSPNGQELLDTVLKEDPALADRVLRLLGLRRVTPEQAQAQEHFEAGEVLFQARDFVAARERYAAALALDPALAVAALYVGDASYHLGEYHLAQAFFVESLAIAPSAQGHRFLGDALRQGGHGDARARAEYKRAVGLDPNYGGARQALAALGPEPDGEALPDAPEPPALLGPRPPLAEAPSPRVAELEASGRVGDRIRAAVLRLDGEGTFADVLDDDARFTRWLALASPAELAKASELANVLAFQYEIKDRDLPRSRTAALRLMAAAEALPEDFGPAGSHLEHGRDRLLADAHYVLARVRTAEGRLPEARALYELALVFLTEEQAARAASGLTDESEQDRLFLPTGMRGAVARELADVCRRLGDDDAALALWQEANRLEGARRTTEVEVERFIRDADSALLAGDANAALGLFQHALYLAEDENPIQVTPRMVTNALNALGRGYLAVGAPRAALGCFDRARTLNERTGNANRLSFDHRAIASVLAVRPALSETTAREHLERALAYGSVVDSADDELSWTASDGVRHRISAPDRAWPTLLELGQLLEDRDAVPFLALATRVADLVRAGLFDDTQRMAVQEDQLAAYAELTLRHTRLGDTAQAWVSNEAMRARTFLDALGDADLTLPAGVPAALADRERELLEQRRALRASGRSDTGFWAEYREVADELDALWQSMRAAEPTAEGYVEVREARPAEPTDLTELLAAEERPAVLATLVRLGDRLGVLALRGDTSEPVLEAVPADLARLDRFVASNFGSAGRVRELAEDMEDLFQHELAPVTELLTRISDPQETLVVCPVGRLHHVPLSALRSGETPLLERNPLAVLPSASLLRALRSAAHHAPAVPAAVFGDPTLDLPGARTEAEAIARRFGVAERLGPQATTAAVRSALTAAGVLHVAAHARFDAADALASGVVLADGTLSARELLALRAPALSLVVLSACETGVTESDAAEELVGLTRALLFAGADTIVVSLWKVPDAPTLDVMSEFYGALAGERPKVDALQHAVLAARERHGPGRFDRWAGFQLVGDWR